MKAQQWLFVLLLLAAALQSMYYYPRLPETVASHFDGAGNPNGWSSKPAFFGMYIGMLTLTTCIFAILPASVTRLPASLISLPKKDYWLAPERRGHTETFIRRQMLWFGIVTLIFNICTIQLAIRANLLDIHHFSSGSMWTLLGGYCMFTLVWLVHFISKFRRAL
ncbi:MAG: DUF1648 domain-containing protein [Candidatus Methylomirabilales bacterium]